MFIFNLRLVNKALMGFRAGRLTHFSVQRCGIISGMSLSRLIINSRLQISLTQCENDRSCKRNLLGREARGKQYSILRLFIISKIFLRICKWFFVVVAENLPEIIPEWDFNYLV